MTKEKQLSFVLWVAMNGIYIGKIAFYRFLLLSTNNHFSLGYLDDLKVNLTTSFSKSNGKKEEKEAN